MASTYTLNQGIEKPGTGEQSGTWGNTTNTNFDIIDRALSGVGAISLTGTTTTLTTTDGSLTDGMYKVLVLGGSPSGTNTITIGDNTQDKVYFVVNNSGQEVIFTQGTGANATIANGAADIIYADGAGSGAAVASFFGTALKIGTDVTVGDDLTLSSDSAVLGFGADTDTTLTHTDGTGLTLNSTNKLTFGDAASFIQQSGDGILQIDGEATINMNASTALTVSTDTATFTSANSTDPVVIIKNTTNDANGSRLHFVKDKGAAGADGDDIGTIEWIGDDDGQNQTSFAKIVGEVSESANTDEAGKLSFFVAESDGTNTALTAGLVLEGEHATDGEVDVTIGAGIESTTSVAGNFNTANQVNITAADGVADNDYVVEIQNAEATDGRSFGVRIKAGSTSADQSFVIQDHDASNTLFKITGDGDVNVGIGDILFGTSGKGINLGVTSNTDSNTLDDYEEGTHTIAFDLATSGSITPKDANKVAGYIKIGTLCFIGCDLRTASTSSPNGSVRITTPFTNASIGDFVTLGSPIAGVGITTQTSQLGSFYMRGIIGSALLEVHYNTGASNFGLQGQNSGLDGNDELQFNAILYTT